MENLTIKTNNHWHYFIYGWDLPESARKEFDYLDDEQINEGSFFKYRGHYYSLNDFIRCNDQFGTWQGYASDSYFSGVLIRLSEDGEQYQVATYYS